jgi:catechol 2,3-dioxygenase-like lactoylglutathione lyase family enzyme
VAGVRALLDAGVEVVVNHLLFRDNAHLLTAFVELAAARWAGAGARLVLQFHTPRDEFRSRAEALRHVARYRELAAPLRAALDRARQLGLEVRDLQDPTGIPSLCVLGADERDLGPIRPQAGAPRAHAAERDWFTRVAACGACGLAEACLGVPRAYLALHGDEEFHAVAGRGP